MYHIPADKRAAQSAGLLYDGLLRCLEHTALPDITVTRLCRASGVSRATFYRLFDNVVDVADWKLESLFTDALHVAAQRGEGSCRETFLTFIGALTRNRPLLAALDRNARTDLLYAVHTRHSAEIRGLFRPGVPLTPAADEALTALLAAIIPGLFSVWVRHPEQSPEELLAQLQESLCLLEALFCDGADAGGGG